MHINDFRLTWMPNEALIRKLSATNVESTLNTSTGSTDDDELPPGWDRAYDPVTGHEYYIDHRNLKTTWVDPRTPAKEAKKKELAAVLDDCTVVIDLLATSPLMVVVWASHADVQAGSIAVTCMLPTGEPGCTVFVLPRGLAQLVSLFQRCSGCHLVVASPDVVGHMLWEGAPNTALRDNSGCGDGSAIMPHVQQQLAAEASKTETAATTQHECCHTANTTTLTPTPVGDAQTPADNRITRATWLTFLDAEGRHLDWDAFRKLVFFRGLHEVTLLAWICRCARPASPCVYSSG